MIIGIILFLISVFWAYKDVRSALFFLVLLLPLNHKELFSMGMWNLLPVRIALVGVLLGWFSRQVVLQGKDLFYRSLSWLRDPVFVLLILLWLVRLASLPHSRNLVASSYLLGFFTSVVGLYILLKWLRKTYGFHFISTLFNFYLIVCVLSALWSIVQYAAFYIWDVSLPAAIWPTEYQPLRVGAFFWDINHFAAYLATAIPVLALLAIDSLGKKPARSALLLWGGVLISTAALVMTLSRSGWGAVGVAFIFSLVSLFVNKKTRRQGLILASFLGLLFSILVLGSVFMGLPVLNRLDTITNVYNSDSIKAHASILRGAVELFRENPILGSGYGSFSEHFETTEEAVFFFSKDPVQHMRVPAHSIWGEVISETGILGFVFYLGLFFTFLRIMFIRFFSAKKSRFYILGSFSAILGLLFSGIFYSYNLIFFWFFIFMAYQLASCDERI